MRMRRVNAKQSIEGERESKKHNRRRSEINKYQREQIKKSVFNSSITAARITLILFAVCSLSLLSSLFIREFASSQTQQPRADIGKRVGASESEHAIIVDDNCTRA